VWQIGNEGGFLAAPVNLTAVNDNKLLMALAERADVIVDFTHVPVGSYVLHNVGPDEPFPEEDGGHCQLIFTDAILGRMGSGLASSFPQAAKAGAVISCQIWNRVRNS
jgi:hypothetical protein